MDSDEAETGLPLPIPLDVYWLREPQAESLRACLAIVDAVVEEIDRVVAHRVPTEYHKLGLWEREDRLRKWGTWSELDSGEWHRALAIRRRIMSSGEKAGTASELDRITLGLVSLLRTTRQGRPRF